MNKLYAFTICFFASKCIIFCHFCCGCAEVQLGIDQFFSENYAQEFKNKNIGLITNQTGVNSKKTSTIQLFEDTCILKLKAIFAPEHGLSGAHYASELIKSKKQAVPIYSLFGKTRRPTKDMLKGIDVLVFDIQDIGVRSYTYASTLYYIMEEAAKYNICVVVLDRPNPINGITIDGPMLDEKKRSFIGYIDVPYCHGMTIGELSQYFNEEYNIHCRLKVIPMKGWKRTMTFKDTGLQWIPTSPHIPESDTPFFYATTGILGELNIVNIGVGYTLPFKLVGAPWIDGKKLSQALNKQKLSGVYFHPFQFKPFYGASKGKYCEGVLIQITDPLKYKPVTIQYFILGVLKTLYPHQFEEVLKNASKTSKSLFCKAFGSDEILQILTKEKYISWKLIELHKTRREAFEKRRKKYLIPSYN